jgi:magnesium-transporting ATPase (P-type)
MAGLRSFSGYYTRVVRDGKEKRIKSALIVPGDIVLIGPGDRVPADIRLIDDPGLEITKNSIFDNTQNCAFMGTWVISGTGRGVVVASGMATPGGAQRRFECW